MLAAAAVAVAAIAPTRALADFRTGNTWVATPKVAVAEMNQELWFSGAELGSTRWAMGQASCKGDRDPRYARKSPGFYHHQFCAATLADLPAYSVSFEYWAIGNASYRLTNIQYHHHLGAPVRTGFPVPQPIASMPAVLKIAVIRLSGSQPLP